MKTITLQMLVKQMKDDARTNKGCGLFFLVLFGLILFGGGAVVHPILSLIVLGAFGLGAWAMLRSSHNTQKSLKNNSFYLTTGVCRSKHITPGGEEGDSYILIFDNGYEHTIGHGDTALCSSEETRTDEWLYNNTAPEDRFYLVYMDGENHPDYIIAQKLCQLDTTGFVWDGDRLFPRQNR